jgi:hypothetical protein
MRKLVPFFATLVFLALQFSSCKKAAVEKNTDDDNGETLPEYDNTAFGVYRGTLTKWLPIDPDPTDPTRTGGSGNIKLVINNGNNMAKAYINIDNIIYDTLISTATFTLGQPITNVLFTGNISTIWFSVNADGSNPVFNRIIINGPWYSGIIEHSTSTQIVSVYQGTFVSPDPRTSDETGLLNFIKKGDSLKFIQRYIYGTENRGTGLVSGSNFALQDNYFNAAGAFSSNNYSGTWQMTLPPNVILPRTGTFKGTKTL